MDMLTVINNTAVNMTACDWRLVTTLYLVGVKFFYKNVSECSKIRQK